MNEQAFKHQFRRNVLHFLLEKYERSKAFREGSIPRQRPQFAMRQNNPFRKDYEDEMDFYKREWMHEVLLDMSAEGIVDLVWEKFQEGRILKKVYLQPQAIDRAYKLAGRESKQKQLERMKQLLQPLQQHPWAWVRHWCHEKLKALANRQTGGLQIDDPQAYRHLVRVLQRLPEVNTNIPKRVFSQALFADTKFFERHVEQRLVSLIRNNGPVELETAEDALNYVGIVSHPTTVYLSGKLQFHTPLRRKVHAEHTSTSSLIDTGVFPGGLGLMTATIREMEIEQVDARRLVLIENLTSYEQWVNHRKNEDELVLYTGGFPHRTLQMFLSKFAAFLVSNRLQDFPLFFWGDIDLGGIRIFEYMKKTYFSSLKPLLMDAHTLERYKTKGTSLKPAYLKSLEQALRKNAYPSWTPVIQKMLAEEVRLEQETIRTEDLEI